MAPDYMKNLSSLLSSTPRETIHTYLLWKQIQSHGSYVEADAVTPLRQLSNELQGKVRRWDSILYRRCMLTVTGSRLNTGKVENLR